MLHTATTLGHFRQSRRKRRSGTVDVGAVDSRRVRFGVGAKISKALQVTTF